MIRNGNVWKGVRTAMFGLLVLAFCLTGVKNSYSAEVITKIQIQLTENWGKGEILEPGLSTPADNTYEITSIAWSKKVKDWEPGKMVTCTVTLDATMDEFFFMESYQKGHCTIKGGGEFVSAKCKGSSLIVKFRYYPVVILGETDKAGWSDNRKSVAAWHGVRYATAYEIKLYETDELTHTIKGIQTNSKDLSSYIKNESDYYYEVRAVAGADDKKYVKSGEFVQSEMTTIDDVGEMKGRFQTTKDGIKYKDEDGNMAVNTWKYIWGFWYYFNENGFRVTGWNLINGQYYYMNETGEMQTGWFLYNGSWYYLAPSGQMVVGWVEAKPGQWYYTYPDGRMAANTTIDGKYWVNGDGLWVQ